MSDTMASTSVRAWQDEVEIPTYPVQPPDRNPMFLEKRVYQGSSGKVYPNPFTDRVSDQKRNQKYQALFLENEYLRLMILPEIGGRIHIGQDKTNDYDFFYRQNVIKPALVGLLGPWISGGVEFNWPQHHRPSTYMPVHWEIEKSPDGSKTVWLSEHEPMHRMKGMVGICLQPAKALIEAKVRLYNRTPVTQTFLWWANVGIRVHDQYQAFFPPDVTFVADHAKRAMSSFPVARDFYYGVDYRQGVDISWYKNIPVPTSYMVTESQYDFFGGYDYSAQAGIVHVADRFIAPGKKLWTWGNGDFGYAWDRELTDNDGPYIELMAGVYTDNQPDFSWLLPYETKSFSQYWYPIQQIGPAKNANNRIAINLEQENGAVRIGACVTEAFQKARVILSSGDHLLFETTAEILPGAPFIASLSVATPIPALTLRVLMADGSELIAWTTQSAAPSEHIPAPAKEPPTPDDIQTVEELYVTGLHLEQYRHATRNPETYWEEALRRDPLDSRCNTALGKLLLRRGLFLRAEEHLTRAIQRLTARNPNPATGEAHYYLGLSLLLQDRDVEASAAFYKATWNYEWRSAAYYRLACLDGRRERWSHALERLDQSLATNRDHLHARGLQSAILRRLKRTDEALAIASDTVSKDPLDFLSRFELLLLECPDPESAAQRFAQQTHKDRQLHLDLAFDYAAAGLFPEALALLSGVVSNPSSSTYPMVYYFLSQLAVQKGDRDLSAEYRTLVAMASPDYCFPSRLEEMKILEEALARNPLDAKGSYYLGNLYYDKKRYEDAIALWEKSVELEDGFSIPWRNLGIAYFNIRRSTEQAVYAYERALLANPQDARVVYELDQLRKRTGVPPIERLAFLKKHSDLVAQRDDLTVELVTLYNQIGEPGKALEILLGRRFHPWEGGEGLVSGQYVWAHRLLGISCLNNRDFADALEHFSAARTYPHNLGEGKHFLTQELDLDYFSGVALRELGRDEPARNSFRSAADSDPASPWMSYYKALALRSMGQASAAVEILQEMNELLDAERKTEPSIDYFATSLPNFLVFEDDLAFRKEIECTFTEALVELGLGNELDAARRLQQVVDKDPNHLAAQTMLAQIGRTGDSVIESTSWFAK
jgi:tetratricopeptide (TPR) repeat protein